MAPVRATAVIVSALALAFGAGLVLRTRRAKREDSARAWASATDALGAPTTGGHA